MFPSGQWYGYFEQRGLGRQNMRDLTIIFGEKTVHGTGQDVVGPFSLSGKVLGEHRVEIYKKYHDRHHVVYIGEHAGEGVILGVWSVWQDQGPFALRPMNRFRHDTSEIPELVF